MAGDTRQRILTSALEMFSRNGYVGTNIRELAASLGLAKSAMYRHFESKEDIWNALLDEMIVYYGQRFGSPERLPPAPDSPEGFVAMTMRLTERGCCTALERGTSPPFAQFAIGFCCRCRSA